MRKIVIAIDGYASTGKSSLAKLLSSHLNYIYINSGSMYRAITYYAISKKLIPLTKKNIKSGGFYFDREQVSPCIFDYFNPSLEKRILLLKKIEEI